MAGPKLQRDEGFNILGMPLKPGEYDTPSGTGRTQPKLKAKTKARSVKRAKAPGQAKKGLGLKSARTTLPS